MRHIMILGCLAILTLPGCSSSSGPGHDTEPPPSPQAPSLVYTGNGTVRLSWNPVTASDLAGYIVHWAPGNELAIDITDTLFTPALTVGIAGLQNDLRYTFGVSTVDLSDNESVIASTAGIPFSKPTPAAPVNLVAVAGNIDDPRITLTWSSSEDPGLAYYAIYRALDAASTYYSTALIGTSETAAFIDLSVEIGVPYYYRATAVETGGWESASSTVEHDYALPPVVIVSPVDFAYVSSNPTLVWQAVDGALQYEVVVKTSRIGGEIWNTTVDGTTSHVTYEGTVPLEPGETYYWEIGAISNTEINSLSAAGSFIVNPPARNSNGG